MDYDKELEKKINSVLQAGEERLKNIEGASELMELLERVIPLMEAGLKERPLDMDLFFRAKEKFTNVVNKYKDTKSFTNMMLDIVKEIKKDTGENKQ